MTNFFRKTAALIINFFIFLSDDTMTSYGIIRYTKDTVSKRQVIGVWLIIFMLIVITIFSIYIQFYVNSSN